MFKGPVNREDHNRAKHNMSKHKKNSNWPSTAHVTLSRKKFEENETEWWGIRKAEFLAVGVVRKIMSWPNLCLKEILL